MWIASNELIISVHRAWRARVLRTMFSFVCNVLPIIHDSTRKMKCFIVLESQMTAAKQQKRNHRMHKSVSSPHFMVSSFVCFVHHVRMLRSADAKNENEYSVGNVHFLTLAACAHNYIWFHLKFILFECSHASIGSRRSYWHTRHNSKFTTFTKHLKLSSKKIFSVEKH